MQSLELEQESLVAQVVSLSDKLCFCARLREVGQVHDLSLCLNHSVDPALQEVHPDSELEYMEESSDHSLYFDAYVAPPVEQPAPKTPTDVLIVVPGPLSDQLRACCLGCEDINLSKMLLVPMEDPPQRNAFNVNQGRAMHHHAVHSSQHGCHGGCSDC